MRLIQDKERHSEISASSPSEVGEMQRTESAPVAVSGPAASVAGATGTAAHPRPRGIARVPTHTVGRARERRSYVRANLTLPLSVRTVAGRPAAGLVALRTQDISSSGIFFLCPRRIEPGTPIEMEVVLVDKTSGRGTVRMCTQACVVRAEEAATPGWHGLAAAFDDITFIRDEPFPAA
jgi:hypothetical protein